MITGLCDNYPHLLRRNRKVFVAVLIAFIYLCALPTTTHVSGTNSPSANTAIYLHHVLPGWQLPDQLAGSAWHGHAIAIGGLY